MEKVGEKGRNERGKTGVLGKAHITRILPLASFCSAYEKGGPASADSVSQYSLLYNGLRVTKERNLVVDKSVNEGDGSQIKQGFFKVLV